MRGWLLALVAACGSTAPAPAPQPIANKTVAPALPPPVPTTDVIVAALARFQGDPNTLLDHDLVKPNLFVVVEAGIPVPTLPAPFVVKQIAELEAEATKTKANIGFIHVYSVTVQGDSALLTIGGDIAVPKDPNLIKMCCCESQDRYDLKSGTWVFGARKESICS